MPLCKHFSNRTWSTSPPVKVQPNSFMKTGNISGNSKCEKWELACDNPTNAMMMESSRKGALAGGID